MKNTCHSIIFLTFVLLVSCQNEFGCPDIQDNETLSKNPPQSEVYQHELARLISEDKHEVNYYFKKREADYLVLNAYGWGYCGELHLLMPTEDELSKKLQNDQGYGGAKLKGLQTEYLDKRLKFVSLQNIID